MMPAAIISRCLTALYAGLTALLPLLIEQGAISAMVGVDIGVTVAAVAAGWHGATFAATRTAAPALPAPATMSPGVAGAGHHDQNGEPIGAGR